MGECVVFYMLLSTYKSLVRNCYMNLLVIYFCFFNSISMSLRIGAKLSFTAFCLVWDKVTIFDVRVRHQN